MSILEIISSSLDWGSDLRPDRSRISIEGPIEAPSRGGIYGGKAWRQGIILGPPCVVKVASLCALRDDALDSLRGMLEDGRGLRTSRRGSEMFRVTSKAGWAERYWRGL